MSKLRKPTHFDICVDPNCERKWCVDRRNATCLAFGDCEVPRKSDRCRWCHTRYFCSGYGECELHGDHGP